MIQINILHLFSTIVLNAKKRIYVEVVWNGLILILKISYPFVLNATIKKKYVVNAGQTTNVATNIFVYINVVNVMNLTFATSVLIGLMKTEEIQSVVYAMKNIYGKNSKTKRAHRTVKEDCAFAMYRDSGCSLLL